MPTTLTIQQGLTFNADGTYTYKLNTKKAKADQVIAQGSYNPSRCVDSPLRRSETRN